MIISQTPLRLSFLGGNTDFPEFYKKYGGCVLTTAIDKFVYCTIHKRFDDKIYVSWSKKEIVDDVSQIEHELVREAMKKVGVSRGLEISFYADVPSEGSGLGSSSSVAVGVLNALHQYKGDVVGAGQLAQEACDIELGILKKPIGVQDQYIAAYGGFRFFKFSQEITNEKIILSEGLMEDLDNSLMLFYTGRTRKSKNILNNLKATLSETQKIKLNLKTKELAEEGFKCFQDGGVDCLGDLLNRGWAIKKQMAPGITDPEIDAMYAQALNAGAIGGKIAGAGGGGFMILVVPWEKRKTVRTALKSYREVPFRLEPDGSKIIFNSK